MTTPSNPLLLLLIAGPVLSSATPTFHKDVLPILQRHCQGCHRPGEIGPMPFLTYSQTRPFAAAIREAVRLKRMPPWNADPAHGRWANNPSMTADEITTLSAWAAAKAPEGNPKDAPQPLTFVEGWNIPVPDQVFEMPHAYTVPAKGTIEYTYVILPTGFTEDKWVTMAEVRPGNRSVLHHLVVYLREPGSPWLRTAKPGEPFVPKTLDDASRRGSGENFVGYSPGRPAMQLRPGEAKLIRAGSDLVFQIHYTANGRETEDRTRVGMIFAKEPPARRITTVGIWNRSFEIPARASDHAVESQLTFRSDAEVVSFSPHMHLRGKSFRYDTVDAGQKQETVLYVPKYDFNWQHRYVPAFPVKVTAGSRIECFATFDNSPNNLNNPDPAATVRWGDQSWEEMMIGYIDVAYDVIKKPSEVFLAPGTRPGMFESSR